MDPVEEVNAAFYNNVWRGSFVVSNPYVEHMVFESESVYRLAQNGDTFPSLVNGVRGRGSGAKVWRHSDISISAKYYETVVITRYQKQIEGRTDYLFHAKLYKVKGSAMSVVKKLKREIVMSPREYTMPLPHFRQIEPTTFTISSGKRELIRVTGERLKASSGRLENISSSGKSHDTIFLYISNAVDKRQISAEFNQPDFVTPSSYVMYLVVYDNLYKFDNTSNTIKFVDEIELITKNLFGLHYLDPVLDSDLSLIAPPLSPISSSSSSSSSPPSSSSPSPLSLIQAIELGNTRMVAMHSQRYENGHLPETITEGDREKGKDGEKEKEKDGEKESVRFHDPVSLARNSGNICTLLFVVVWKQVSDGKRNFDMLDKLRNFVLGATKITVGSMLLSMKDESDDSLVLEEAECTIRATAAKAATGDKLDPIMETIIGTPKFDPLEYARQLTLLDFKDFQEMDCELRTEVWNTPQVAAIVNRFNLVSNWVCTEIVKLPLVEDRAMKIENFINMAKYLREIGNFNGAMQIQSGLSMAAVHRLKRSWREVRNLDVFEKLGKELSAERSFANYRAIISSATPPCLPYIGLQLTNLVFVAEGNSQKLDERSTRTIGEIQKFQKHPFNFAVDPQLQHYFSNLRTLPDVLLYNLSLRYEPREMAP